MKRKKTEARKSVTPSSSVAATLTTISSRLTDAELETVRKAAQLRGWSVAQFLQRAAVERATEILNCDEDRGGLSSTARKLLKILRDRPLEVTYKGATISTDSPAWKELDPRDGYYTEEALIDQPPDHMAIKTRQSTQMGHGSEYSHEYSLSIYAIGKYNSRDDKDQYIGDFLTDRNVRQKPVLSIRHYDSFSGSAEVYGAIINGGRDFGDLLRRMHPSEKKPFLVAEKILSNDCLSRTQHALNRKDGPNVST